MRDSRRYEQFKRLMLVCGILQSNAGWWSVSELHAAYRDRVGSVSQKTIGRDLAFMEAVGIVECRSTACSYGFSRDYKWQGWPSALQ